MRYLVQISPFNGRGSVCNRPISEINDQLRTFPCKQCADDEKRAFNSAADLQTGELSESPDEMAWTTGREAQRREQQ